MKPVIEFRPILAPSDWRLVAKAERSAPCRNPKCDYMGVEWVNGAADATANGCCTKCGAIWTTPIEAGGETEISRVGLGLYEDKERLDWLSDYGMGICTEPDNRICLAYWSDADEAERIKKATTLREAIDAARADAASPTTEDA